MEALGVPPRDPAPRSPGSTAVRWSDLWPSDLALPLHRSSLQKTRKRKNGSANHGGSLLAPSGVDEHESPADGATTWWRRSPSSTSHPPPRTRRMCSRVVRVAGTAPHSSTTPTFPATPLLVVAPRPSVRTTAVVGHSFRHGYFEQSTSTSPCSISNMPL